MEEFNLGYMGTLLKAARLDAKLTQDEVAERIGITTRYLMAIENEGKCPALEVWFRLIRALHISADDSEHGKPNAYQKYNLMYLQFFPPSEHKNRTTISAVLQYTFIYFATRVFNADSLFEIINRT